jgi:hypothetical protein
VGSVVGGRGICVDERAADGDGDGGGDPRSDLLRGSCLLRVVVVSVRAS